MQPPDTFGTFCVHVPRTCICPTYDNSLCTLRFEINNVDPAGDQQSTLSTSVASLVQQFEKCDAMPYNIYTRGPHAIHNDEMKIVRTVRGEVDGTNVQ